MSVCLSVRSLAYLKDHASKRQEIFCTRYSTVDAVARSSSDDSAIRYVLPVLWMKSRFHMMGQKQSYRPLANYLSSLARWRHLYSLPRSELLTVTRPDRVPYYM